MINCLVFHRPQLQEFSVSHCKAIASARSLRGSLIGCPSQSFARKLTDVCTTRLAGKLFQWYLVISIRFDWNTRTKFDGEVKSGGTLWSIHGAAPADLL